MLPCFSFDTSHPTVCLTPVVESDFSIWYAAQSSQIQAWVKNAQFTGKSGSLCPTPDAAGRLEQILFGVTDLQDFWAYQGVSQSILPGTYQFCSSIQGNALEIAVLGWALGQYRFETYLTKKTVPAVLVLPALFCLDKAECLAEAIYLTRTLINTPAEDLGPTQLSQSAQKLAAQFGATYQEIVGDALLQQNYPMIHAVGRASDDAPRLVELLWGTRESPRVTLVGKGVCFDTGGLDLKPSDGMLGMKKDMGGAAHVLGLAYAIMAAKLPIQLRVLVPAVENAVSGNAYRPGDVFPTRKGLSVEIGNTDAEGRLILADALTAACEDSPELVIDFATLTGAARVAVGTEIAAFFANQDTLAADLLQSSTLCQDPMWRLPLYRPYRSLIDSPIADINNAGTGGHAGAITAALFLQEFIEPTTPWVHIDLMAWNVRRSKGRAIGAEAMGLRAVFAYLQARFGEKFARIPTIDTQCSRAVLNSV
jgi:leucyl aminopeptidase